MTLYSIALFLHIVGALGIFVALGLEWTSMLRLRRATTAEQVHEWTGVLASLRRVGGPSVLLLLVTGIYLMVTSWLGQAWVGLGLLGLVLLAGLGGALTGRRIGRIAKALATETGAISTALRARLLDPVLALSLNTRTAIALGVVFLMTVKPGPSAAVTVLGLSIALGLLSAAPAFGRRRSTHELA